MQASPMAAKKSPPMKNGLLLFHWSTFRRFILSVVLEKAVDLA
jgi:hypothetical protein